MFCGRKSLDEKGERTDRKQHVASEEKADNGNVARLEVREGCQGCLKKRQGTKGVSQRG